MTKLKRGQSKAAATSDDPPKKRGRRPKAPDERAVNVFLTIPPDVYAAMVKEKNRRFLIKGFCSKSQLMTNAMRDYLGLRGQRDAEVLLNNLAERAARVLHKHKEDSILAEVYHVLCDVTKAGGEDWDNDAFTPKPDELTRLAAENARLRRWVRIWGNITDAQIDEHLAERPLVIYPDDARDGTIHRKAKPPAPVEVEEDDGYNSLGLPKQAEPFMG